MLRSILQRTIQPARFNLAGLSQFGNTELSISRRSFASAPENNVTAPQIISPDEWRNREEVTLKMPMGVQPIDPIQRFADAPEAIKRCTEMCSKFPNPTSVQAQAWPIALAGHDLVSIARTGSGKTLGFLIPVFNHIAKLPRPTSRGFGPAAVILAPTRELAQQIEAEAKSYSNFPLLCAFGGVSKAPQIQRLKQGVDIIIATPGRLNDLLSLDFPATNLDRCSFLVLDEADRMLDMGFEPQLRDILSHMNEKNKRQTLMFSATWPKEVRSLAMDFLNNPVQVNIGGTELNVCPDVHQTFHLTHSGAQKAELLINTVNQLWAKNPKSSVILFTNTKMGAEQVADYIKEKTNARVHTLHGDKSQEQRDFALREFRSGRAPMLVCTDVASRGIDVKNVGCVINYDFPSGGVQDWIHRVGRTGRQGLKGEAVTFLSSTTDSRYVAELETVLSKARQEVPEWLSSLAPSKSHGGKFGGSSKYGNGGSNKFGGGNKFGSRFGSSGGRYGSGGQSDSREPPRSYGYGSSEFRNPSESDSSSSGSSSYNNNRSSGYGNGSGSDFGRSSSANSSYGFNPQSGSGLRRPERRNVDFEDRPMRNIKLTPGSSA